MEAFANQTYAAAVWSGPLAADSPGDSSSASGVAVHAVWISGLAVLARWCYKAVQTVEAAAAGALEVASTVAHDLRIVTVALRRDAGATAQVLMDKATAEAALLLEYVGTLLRVLLVLGFAVALWALSHRAWNRSMHALHGNSTPIEGAEPPTSESDVPPLEPAAPSEPPAVEQQFAYEMRARHRTAAAQAADVRRRHAVCVAVGED